MDAGVRSNAPSGLIALAKVMLLTVTSVLISRSLVDTVFLLNAQAGLVDKLAF